MTVEFSTTTVSQFSGNEIQGTFVRNQSFTQTVTVSIPDSEQESFTITNIQIELLGDEEPITIEVNEPTIDFEGTYLSGWVDVFTHVPAGESNKTTDPIDTDISDLPEGQDLFNLDQDQKHFIPRDYDVTVTYVGDTTQTETTESVTLTHEVFNDLEAIRSFMANYDYGEG